MKKETLVTLYIEEEATDTVNSLDGNHEYSNHLKSPQVDLKTPDSFLEYRGTILIL